MIKDDTLWKGILENVFDDFLRFFFKDADQLFDMGKDFQFLDKELEQLFPVAENEAPKFVDKLVKVFTKKGTEEWLLVHIEVQGYNDKEFAKRMFTYFYRILDKYNMPVTAFAIFTDNNKKYHPKAYQYEHLGTKNSYHFNTYKIIDQDAEVLSENENPFAIVILTVLLAIKRKTLSDEDLLKLKLQIFRNLSLRKVSPEKMRGLNTFLNLYVRFAKPETKAKFDTTIITLTENNTTMGIVEMVLDRAKKEGLEEGMEKGIEVGTQKTSKQKDAKFVTALLTQSAFSVKKIAQIADVSEDFVIGIKKKL